MRSSFLILSALLILMVYVHYSEALSCKKCQKSVCKRVSCGGRVKVKDACGCCLVCSKSKGQKCGGPWNLDGKCDRGLVCRRKGQKSTGIDQRRGTCQCRKVRRPLRRCPGGYQRNKYGCLTGKCKKISNLPRCKVKSGRRGKCIKYRKQRKCIKYRSGQCKKYRTYRICIKYRGNPRCYKRRTIFCNKKCKKCCYHTSTCAPNRTQKRKSCRRKSLY